ncbi:MAG: hypothetical protein LBL04_10010 [Bacteroidales bacterium]|nr:hypothetical protein [Bacteroidales bacterium]
MAYLFVLAVLFAHSNCRAQDCNYVFGSRIVNDSTLSSVRDCHVSNKTQRTGTVSNVYGDFRITASVNDSISFSAIGYEELTIALTDSIFTRRHVIRLKPIAYELGEVTITPYHLDLPPISKFSIPAPAPLPGQGGVNIPTGISPVTFLYDRFSKEGKQKRYYGKLTEGTADFMLIGEKFNGELVSQITGLKEEELIKFMSFCGFSSDFLKNYSPETIKRAIREKYKAYRKNFPEGR